MIKQTSTRVVNTTFRVLYGFVYLSFIELVSYTKFFGIYLGFHLIARIYMILLVLYISSLFADHHRHIFTQIRYLSL